MQTSFHRGAAIAACAAALLGAGPAGAASALQFDVQYLGDNTAALLPGSDSFPAVMAAGDSFAYTLNAQDGAYWRVDAGGDYFALFALAVDQPANRTGDVSVSLLLDGVLQQTFAGTGIVTGLTHVGTNDVPLAAGLRFDSFTIDYRLESVVTMDGSAATPVTTLVGPLPVFGAPEFDTLPGASIAYVAPIAAVPEPHGSALLLGGLLAGAALRRRRG